MGAKIRIDVQMCECEDLQMLNCDVGMEEVRLL
jgi:hypothetical protein